MPTDSEYMIQAFPAVITLDHLFELSAAFQAIQQQGQDFITRALLKDILECCTLCLEFSMQVTVQHCLRIQSAVVASTNVAIVFERPERSSALYFQNWDGWDSIS